MTLYSKSISKGTKILLPLVCTNIPCSQDVRIFLSRSHMCSNGYTISIDMSNILVKIYKYNQSNNLYKWYVMVINITLNKLLVSLVYESLRKILS